MKFSILAFIAVLLTGCSALADIETAKYDVLKSTDEKPVMEVRHYPSLVLVSTPMGGEGRNGAFGRLFDYISGANTGEAKIEMTAPVIMDDKAGEQAEPEGVKIPMTAPVFMDESAETAMMSFVLPAKYTIETVPKPMSDEVVLSEVKDYTVAAIIFSGRLSESNIAKHKKILQDWVAEEGLTVTGPIKTAGYNAPFTLPMLRRNEVLIPVEKP